MTKAQIIITLIFITLGLIYYIIGEDIKAKHKLVVVYNNEVVEVIVTDLTYKNIQLRKKANLDIYFDGEYFFNSIPYYKELYKTKIIEHTLVNKELPKQLVFIWGFLFYTITMLFTIPHSNVNSDYY